MIIGKGSAQKGFMWFGEIVLSSVTASVACIASAEAHNWFFFTLCLGGAVLWGYKLYKEYKAMEN